MKAVEYDKNNRQSSAKEFKAELLSSSTIVVCPTCSSINARESQKCVKDGTLLPALNGLETKESEAVFQVSNLPLPKQEQSEVTLRETSAFSATQDMSLKGESFPSDAVFPTTSIRPERSRIKPDDLHTTAAAKQQFKVSPAHIDSGKPGSDAKGRASFLVRSLVWMRSITVGIIFGAISCPLTIVLGLIEGVLKGIIIGILIGGTGILISRALGNAYGTFTRAETWLLVGIGILILSAIVYPMVRLIKAHGNVSFYQKYCQKNHGRYAAVVGLLAALSAIAYFAIKFMDKIAPFITRYTENAWDFLIAHI